MPPVTYPMPLQLALGEKNAASTSTGKTTALLVAGINYPRRSSGNADASTGRTYFDIAVRYKDWVLKEKKVDRVIIFDFLKGETVTFELGVAAGTTTVLNGPLLTDNFRYCSPDTKTRTGKPWGSQLKVKKVPDVRRYYFTAIHDLAKKSSGDPNADVLYDDYHKWTGGQGAEKSMSISDVYEMFTRVSSPTYKELHFFGHATHDGPVIVNTDEYGNKFHDKDGRRNDFTNRNLAHVFGAANIAKSRDSFHKDPVLCVWGCDTDNQALLLLQEIQKERDNKQNAEADKKLIRAKLADNYAARLAKALGFPVLCALPGTGAVHDGVQVEDPDNTISFQPRAMHVSFTAHRRHMEMYREFFGIKFATTGAFKGDKNLGRGYAFFDP